ncbi:membrane dipeptidase [Candidatus Bathyarchaeota archaeon]|nr:membrane dipeptidase [Candidatus Bathyarchaeota archaeon]
MGKNKKYSGYRAYQYLEAGVDYKPFKLAKGIGRVKAYWVPLLKVEEERAEELLEKCVVVSMHDHPVLFPEDMSQLVEYQREGREFLAYEDLSRSCLDAVFDNMMDGTAYITSKAGWKWGDVIYDLGMRLCDLAHQDFVIKCEKVEDILEAHRTGRIALIPSLESATPIENEVDRIDILYGLGVRMMGIVYSESNALGSGLREPRDGGLTDFGYDCVKRMNKIGMAIDVSHAGDQTALDTIEASDKPIMISHAGARALNGTARMFPDEVLTALAERDGVIGIEAAPHTTYTRNHPEHSIESYMEHMEYCIELMGIDHVGAGPDTLYGDHVALHRVWFGQTGRGHYPRPRTRAGVVEPRRVEYVRGLENPSECLINITRWLVKHGYSDQEIEKLIGGNALRLLRRVWWR